MAQLNSKVTFTNKIKKPSAIETKQPQQKKKLKKKYCKNHANCAKKSIKKHPKKNDFQNKMT